MKWFSHLYRVSSLLGLGAVLFCATAEAQDEHLPTYRPQLSALLQRAGQDIPQGEAGDGARRYLASAQCLNGDFEAAKVHIAGLSSPSARSRLWAKLGYFQRKHKKDAVEAKASFEAAKKEAALIKGSTSDRESQLADVARFQARADDVAGALETVSKLSAYSRFRALSGVARVAARQGEVAPAEQLLGMAKEDEEKSLANSLICIGHAEAYDSDKAVEVLKKEMMPLHRVPALLALFDSRSLLMDETDTSLAQALALVPQIQSEDEFDTSGVARDADYGAIAVMEQYNFSHPNPQASATKSLDVLRLVKDGRNAQQWTLRLAALLAEDNLPKALELVEMGGNDVATMGAVVKVLGEKWAEDERTEAEKTALHTEIAKLINKGMDKVRALEDSDKGWALAGVAMMTAQARDFNTAKEMADQIETPRRKAYGFAGIARAAIEQNSSQRVQWSLGLLEAAAQEAEPKERGEIIGQCVEGILEPLLDEEPVSFGAAVAGLD